MARFHVRDTFTLNDKITFVMAGFIIEGEVLSGMAVRIPFNANVKMTAGIDRIEYVRRPDGDVICLCVKCSVADEVTLWEALKIKDQTIEIVQAG
jgi:hypothetical protein